MTTKTTTRKTAPLPPEVPNFKFERHAAALSGAKERASKATAAGKQGRAESDSHAVAVRTGAGAFLSLLQRIKTRAESDISAFMASNGGEYGDARNYRAIVALIEADLISQVAEAGPSHREGYLRAIADMLCLAVDGCGVGPDWDPLASSVEAFATPGEVDLQPASSPAPPKATQPLEVGSGIRLGQSLAQAQDAVSEIAVRLHQAAGIAAMAARAYSPDYTSSERPHFDDLYRSLDFACDLLRECLTHLLHLDGQAGTPLCDDWCSDVYNAASMLDMFSSLVWSDNLELHVSDAELHGFLNGVAAAASRALAALEASRQARTSK
ncbi:hypothetical protein SNE35_18735 [Paucibacter sp. R3-3]|uniref:Uncharacterized protein n=1 Tax=Roseateles agri TaxID=3098619 RepID=A0ABU5DJT9_9BURK|nr:hypothetical protein [Paucibacter sp. R3-3]MDY0746557.1 hypothetical protein [Paucibacter sp. R3-3]